MFIYVVALQFYTIRINPRKTFTLNINKFPGPFKFIEIALTSLKCVKFRSRKFPLETRGGTKVEMN